MIDLPKLVRVLQTTLETSFRSHTSIFPSKSDCRCCSAGGERDGIEERKDVKYEYSEEEFAVILVDKI